MQLAPKLAPLLSSPRNFSVFNEDCDEDHNFLIIIIIIISSYYYYHHYYPLSSPRNFSVFNEDRDEDHHYHYLDCDGAHHYFHFAGQVPKIHLSKWIRCTQCTVHSTYSESAYTEARNLVSTGHCL